MSRKSPKSARFKAFLDIFQDGNIKFNPDDMHNLLHEFTEIDKGVKEQ
jgi:hypothetical protein